MYKVTNITKGTTSECDAIETINTSYQPTELENAEGFKAMTIVTVSPSEQYYQIDIYALEGHTLSGGEDEGRYEDIPEPEEEEE